MLLFHGPISRLDSTEERISKHENRLIETYQTIKMDGKHKIDRNKAGQSRIVGQFLNM